MRMEPRYLPTSEQIIGECLTIRASWSPAETRRRLVGYSQEMVDTPWLPPRINTSMCTSRVRKEVSEQTA